jgi:Caspase domain
LRALVIGVDHYEYLPAWQHLRGCVNDALAFRAFLEGPLGVPADRIELALSAAPGRAVPACPVATGAWLRGAFARLVADACDGEEIVVFYAGHGVRVSSAATGEYVYGFAPADVMTGGAGFATLILGRELNELARALAARGANPTLVADTCHSASSVRALRGAERRLVTASGEPAWRLSAADWAELAGAHPAFEPSRDAKGGPGGSGWLGERGDWVMLAACRDDEVACEVTWSASGEPRGALTACLLDELERVPAGAHDARRWCDVMPGVQRAVHAVAGQQPVLEGRPERRLFGGGFTAAPPGGAVAFGEAPGVSAAVVRTRVRVSAGARAAGTLAPAGPSWELVEAGPAELALRPWSEHGWVLVPYDAAAREPTTDDVIAYLGDAEPPAFAAKLDAAAAHWARYRAVRDRRPAGTALAALVDVALRVGATATARVRLPPDATGVHHVRDDAPLWVEMAVRRSVGARVFLGVVLCSDDGNVIALWPPRGGDPSAAGGQTIYVGEDQHTPAVLTIRRDQQASRYTFKVIACTLARGAPPPELASLAIDETVQDVVDAVAAGAPRHIVLASVSPPPSWAAWDLVVRVSRT